MNAKLQHFREMARLRQVRCRARKRQSMPVRVSVALERLRPGSAIYAEYVPDGKSRGQPVEVMYVHASGLVACREINRALPGVLLATALQLRHWNRHTRVGGTPFNVKTWSGK